MKYTLVGGNQKFPSCYLSNISFQTCWKEINLLILDEKSMVGRLQVGQMDCYLCKACPQNTDEILGGIPAIFFGDIGQLPPVGDSPMYSDKLSAYHTGSSCRRLSFVWVFQTVWHFKFIVRLVRVLNSWNLERFCSKWEPILDDFELFSGHFLNYLTSAKETEFNDVLHLLPTWVSVLEFNPNYKGI